MNWYHVIVEFLSSSLFPPLCPCSIRSIRRGNVFNFCFSVILSKVIGSVIWLKYTLLMQKKNGQIYFQR